MQPIDTTARCLETHRSGQLESRLQTFSQALRNSDFVITAKPPLTVASSADDLRRAADLLRNEVIALQIDDNAFVEGHMSPLAAFSICRAAGIDCIAHLSCRDRNSIALQAGLLGLAAMGADSILVSRGEKLPMAARSRTRGIFELKADKLLQMASTISGSAAESNTEYDAFKIGSLLSVIAPKPDWKAARIIERIEHGATFFVSRPCLNAELARRYLRKLVELRVTHRAAVIVEVPLITSEASAQRIKEYLPAAVIPPAVLKRLASATDSVAEGIAICAEVLIALRGVPGVSGALISYDRHPEDVAAVLQLAASDR